MKQLCLVYVCLHASVALADLALDSGAQLQSADPGLANESALRPYQLSLFASIPEGLGAAIQWRPRPWFALLGYYARATPLQVKVKMAAKSLANRDGFAVQSPQLVLPFNVDFGPHRGVGLRIFPWEGGFFIETSLEQRTLHIRSQLESQLIFVDPLAHEYSHTVFAAKVKARTEQTLLRTLLAYNWDKAHEAFHYGIFAGFSQGLAAQTQVQTDVLIRNPEASDPREAQAGNLGDAERLQEANIEEKARRSLRSFERMTLPVLGLSVGYNF